MARPALLYFALAAALALPACSHEHIVLDVDEGGEAAERATLDEAGALVCTAATAGEACSPNGGPCAAAADCCSLRCNEGECLAAGSCRAPAVPCTTRSDCCSGRCEPSAAGGLACLDYCARQGARCDEASDCCSLSCDPEHRSCGGPACRSLSAACVSDAQCCSGVCDPARATCAALPSSTCLESGEACGTGALACCSGSCASGTCAAGPGPCLQVSAPCTRDGDCCRGACVTDDGRSKCVASCLADGASCSGAGDCCGGACSGNPPVCGASSAACKVVGGACESSADCCAGACTEEGNCVATCAAPP